jgi:hypothetical protein
MKKQLKLLLSLLAAGAGVWMGFAFSPGPQDTYYTLTTGGAYYELNSSYTFRRCSSTSSYSYCEYSYSSDIGTYVTGEELQSLGASGYAYNYWYDY